MLTMPTSRGRKTKTQTQCISLNIKLKPNGDRWQPIDGVGAVPGWGL